MKNVNMSIEKAYEAVCSDVLLISICCYGMSLTYHLICSTVFRL
jgi:hypothetical protein